MNITHKLVLTEVIGSRLLNEHHPQTRFNQSHWKQTVKEQLKFFCFLS